MKHILSLFLLFAYHYAYGQTYKFDQLSTFDLVGKNKVIATTQKLINSEDLYYSLDLKSNNTAELKDNITFQQHFFNIVKQADNHLVFHYLRTCDEKDIHDDIKNTGRDYRIETSVNNQYVLGKYDSAESKHPYFEIRFKMEEAIENQLGLLHTIDSELLAKFVENVNQDKKYSIKKLNYYVNGKKAKEQTVKAVAAMNVEVKLPEKLNFKCLSR